MNMWIHPYHLWLVIVGERIFRSGVSASPFVAVPGTDPDLTDVVRQLCRNTYREERQSLGSTATSAPSRSGSKGKSFLCIPCAGPSNVEGSPPEPGPEQTERVFFDEGDQFDFLQSLSTERSERRYFNSIPGAQDFLLEYNSRRQKDPTFLHSVFQYLINTEIIMSDRQVGVWVELFTYISGQARGNFSEIAGILYGFHSLLTKHAHQRDAARYITVAIDLIKQRCPRVDLDNLARARFIQEILSPRSGLSAGLRTYQNLRDTVAYEPRLQVIFGYIEDRSYHRAMSAVSSLKTLVRKDNPNFSAQSKTAAIALLYHFTKLSGEDWNSVSVTARRIYVELLNHQEVLFDHDAQLLDYLSENLGRPGSTSTSNQ